MRGGVQQTENGGGSGGPAKRGVRRGAGKRRPKDTVNPEVDRPFVRLFGTAEPAISNNDKVEGSKCNVHPDVRPMRDVRRPNEHRGNSRRLVLREHGTTGARPTSDNACAEAGKSATIVGANRERRRTES
ncbi:hypothetical protein EDB84DRAFT_1433151 [Lactarius hengduanensis]|nr:hypothetical protein EDB84DRAFT_1433151 [Lactarius hengduanensis]